MRRLTAIVLAAVGIAVLAPGAAPRAQTAEPPCVFGAVPHCATAHWPVAGADAISQNLIDRGVAMLYGFNGGEARAYFARAAAHQTAIHRRLAFPYWGIAESYTIDINLPWTADTESAGSAAALAARKALAGEPKPSHEVYDLVHAAAVRFSGNPCRTELDAYGSALDSAALHHAGSANFLVVAGFALLTMDNADNPDPAQQSACPQPAAVAAGAAAEEIDHTASATPHYPQVVKYMALARSLQPWNLGLHHLSIHEHEYASNTTYPNRWQNARHDANALAAYSYPDGLSHLAHMAGHIFTRDGEYQRTIDTNAVALDNDHRYYALADGDGQHYLNRYHTHDIDFVLYALTTDGYDDKALDLVKGGFRPMTMASGGRPIEQYPNGRPLLSLLLRLHDTKGLPSPHPDDAIRQPWRARLGALSAARQGYAALALEMADASSVAIHDDTLSYLARAQLAKIGRLPAAQASQPRGCRDEMDCYTRAYALNSVAYNGDPKDYWYVPVGEGYGAALLGAGRYADAKKVFAAELTRFPRDPHLEWGLSAAYAKAPASSCGPDHASSCEVYYRDLYKAHWHGAADLSLQDLG